VLSIRDSHPKNPHQQQLSWRDWRPTFVAAVLSTLAVVVLILAFESVSPFERPAATESLAGAVSWIASATIGACGTIAALMLTTISLMQHLETRRLGPRFLFHMRLTVLGAITTIGFAIAALLVTTFPIAGGTDIDPPAWQINLIFFGLQALTALTVGGLAVVLSSLYATVVDVFGNLPKDWVDEILAHESDHPDESDQATLVDDPTRDRPTKADAATSRHEPPAAVVHAPTDDIVVPQRPTRSVQ